MALAVDAAGNAYCAGRKFVTGAGNEMFAMRLDAADGNVAWTALRGGTGLVEDAAWDVVVGADGHPVIAGVVENAGGVAATVVRKLDASDGGLIWDRELPDAVADIASAAHWLANLAGGDVAVCARVFGANGYDTALHRLAGATGTPTWSVRYDGATHGGDDPRGLALDAAGDLLVCGVQDVWWNYDYMLLKFAAADGALVWEGERYDGPPGWYDVGTCLGVAADGTIVVAGLSDGSGTDWDVATVGFAPDTGLQTWSHRYDGPSSASDQARDVVVAADGTVFVTGYAYAGATGKDLLAMRLDPASVSAVPDRVPGAAALRAWPNPFNPRVELAYELAAAGPTRLAVYDLRGARIALLQDGPLAAGPHRWAWNGRDEAGNRVAAGVYLIRLAGPDGPALRRVTLLP